MSWGTVARPESRIVWTVYCPTCHMYEECSGQAEAERKRSEHHQAHDERYEASDGMDLGYDLNPDPDTRRRQ